MSTVSCLSEEGCLGAVYNFFLQSNFWVTASLVVEAVVLIIGILAITRVLPGIGIIPGAVMTGLGGFFLGLTLALVCSRYSAQEKKQSFGNHSIISSDQSQIRRETDVKTAQNEGVGGGSDSSNLGQPILMAQSNSNVLSANWKEKLEQVRAKNQKASPPLPEVPPEECLNVLSFLAQAGTPCKLFKEPIAYFKPANEKMKTLMKQCQNKNGEELYLSIAHTFLENIPALNVFIRAQTQAIVLQKPTDEESNRFKIINKQIRMILLFLMSHEPKKSEYLESYQKHVTHSFGNRQWNTVDFQQPCEYFHELQALKKEKAKDFCDFLFVFSIYRRHSLLRLCSTKIEARSKCHDMELRTLLSATWFHGTRATTSLSETDFVLMPTGWLHQVDHISFFGEMSEGCQSHGVNAHSLSGTYLDHVDWCVDSYATRFQFNIKNEIDEIDEFLEISIDMSNPSFHNNFVQYSGGLPRIEVALKRWVRWDQAAFKEKIPLLLSKLKHLKEAISVIEKKRPQEIFAWHDSYYSSKYESLCHSVEQIEAFLSSPLPPALTKEQKKNIKENFPAVLGSMTLLSEPTSYRDESGEHLVRGIAQLGKDLQLLCVEKGNLEKARQWVQDHLPSANIKIFSFEQLQEAQKVNRIISPYLADIFSLNKFNKLCMAACSR